MSTYKKTAIIITAFTLGFVSGTFSYRNALDSCLKNVSGKCGEVISYAGVLEAQNAHLRDGVMKLEEHLLECERNLPMGCIRGAYYPDGQ
jgi:hypothetical protein|tara:strand:+ start:2850 stop:3119 length:270 start_codon:yes stop_codon:yes gene_type:complete